MDAKVDMHRGVSGAVWICFDTKFYLILIKKYSRFVWFGDIKKN